MLHQENYEQNVYIHTYVCVYTHLCMYIHTYIYIYIYFVDKITCPNTNFLKSIDAKIVLFTTESIFTAEHNVWHSKGLDKYLLSEC